MPRAAIVFETKQTRRHEMKMSESKHSMSASTGHRLLLAGSAGLPAVFLSLFEQGIEIFTDTGVNLKELLCRQVGIAEDYLSDRVQTIFLNGKPVDNVDTAVVENGARITLSASMPGFAGATLRRGGFFAGMRSSISYSQSTQSGGQRSGRVRLKLFNMIAREIGPALLREGVWLSAAELHAFLQWKADILQTAVQSVQLDDRPLPVEELLRRDFGDALIHLRIRVGDL